MQSYLVGPGVISVPTVCLLHNVDESLRHSVVHTITDARRGFVESALPTVCSQLREQSYSSLQRALSLVGLATVT